MYGATVYIEPKDILNMLSEEDKARFNQCVFSNTRIAKDGSLEMDCLFFNDQDADEWSEQRHRYLNGDEIKL